MIYYSRILSIIVGNYPHSQRKKLPKKPLENLALHTKKAFQNHRRKCKKPELFSQRKNAGPLSKVSTFSNQIVQLPSRRSSHKHTTLTGGTRFFYQFFSVLRPGCLTKNFFFSTESFFFSSPRPLFFVSADFFAGFCLDAGNKNIVVPSRPV